MLMNIATSHSSPRGPSLPWRSGARVLASSRTLSRDVQIGFLLDARLIQNADEAQGVEGGCGWGRSSRNERITTLCKARGLPFLFLEDPYFRSWGLSNQAYSTPAVGVMIDANQPAYDCSGAGSAAEQLMVARIADRGDLPKTDLRNLIVEARLSKYNLPSNETRPVRRTDRFRLGIIDQVKHDRSLLYGGGDDGAVVAMAKYAIDRALGESAELVFRTHPDVAAGKGHSLLNPILPRMCAAYGVGITTSTGSSATVFLDEIDEVLTITSGAGFEALIRGIPVTCFGAPFYAGFGLTTDLACSEDAIAALRRRATDRPQSSDEILRRLDILISVALEDMTLWWDPVKRERCDALQALRRLAWWAAAERFDNKPILIYGAGGWKRAAVQTMAAHPGASVSFSMRLRPRSLKGSRNNLIWGAFGKDIAGGKGSISVEDGFIRSVGLGAALVSPASLVFDPIGLYYDASRPSQIETIIESGVGLTDKIVDRAATLRERIVRSAIEKYNVDDGSRPVTDGKVHLVIGQVVDDQSVLMGSALARPGDQLVRVVRTLHPKAKIAYRAHPDVVAGLRNGDRTSLHADIQSPGGSLSSWLTTAERIHVATSLAGFEALLREVPVSTYGMPFYAGWGLTQDSFSCPRRTRRPTLDEMVAAALILYPRYRSIKSGLRCEVEDILDEIEAIRAGVLASPSRLNRFTAPFLKILAGVGKRSGLRF
ncbi:capsular polysaccharide biosynthesis protein [Mesorhizobium sp. M2A.F.Ca.ET.039.01.1.1]|uniref:capsular polysaccharide export protein, LipB/KpsS family n=1 Tax=Mesorhizobium sp. M2A.F.Ca.ET.039.01.1.1 TaxID=2496746 RepID=UPI000FCA4947|nr:capsular polysaccharide biosynthesis protein [Mesorhizobium sp. M2A.F.Ca.ET.039.01.1.1]RWX60641.1 capsular polysaccharide biosynthesis protein [Mesorhizobium sp. M2A.F.Ca.ET.039.01.1.1]